MDKKAKIIIFCFLVSLLGLCFIEQSPGSERYAPLAKQGIEIAQEKLDQTPAERIPVYSQGLDNERYAPLARDYIERAKEKLNQGQFNQAQAPLEEEVFELSSIPKDFSGASQLPPYFLGIGDEMEIYVLAEDKLSKPATVGPDGKISYPLVGRIQAAGLTIAQLEKKLTQQLAKYVKYPSVSITMRKFTEFKIIVLGEVRSPGIYSYNNSINLIEVLALAGDFTDDARPDSVMVIHGNLTDQPQVRRINLVNAIKKGTVDTDIILQPKDVVYVPSSYIANFEKFLEHINPTVSTAMNVLGLRTEIRILQGYNESRSGALAE